MSNTVQAVLACTAEPPAWLAPGPCAADVPLTGTPADTEMIV